MKNKDKTKTFLLCALMVIWVLATVITVAYTWNNCETGFVNACALIALIGSIVHVVRFTKEFTKEDRRDDS